MTSRQDNPFTALRDQLDRRIAEQRETDERTRQHYLAGEPPADPVERIRYREFDAEKQRAAEREQAARQAEAG